MTMYFRLSVASRHYMRGATCSQLLVARLALPPGSTAAVVPRPFRLGDPAVCMSHPLVTS